MTEQAGEFSGVKFGMRDIYLTGGSHSQFTSALEVNQVIDLDAEAVGNAAEQFDADADLSCFDLPDVGLVASDHQRQLALGQALALPLCAYCRTKALFSVDACHAPIVCGILAEVTC